MYSLEYLPSAASDILEIEAYLYEHSPVAAEKFGWSIERLAETLRLHPLVCPIYEGDGCFRVMVLPYEYRLFYCVDEGAKTVLVYRVLHGRRDVGGVMGER